MAAATANTCDICLNIDIDRASVTAINADGPAYSQVVRIADFNNRAEAIINTAIEKCGVKDKSQLRLKVACTDHAYQLIPSSLFDRSSIRKYVEAVSSESEFVAKADYIKAIDAFGVYAGVEIPWGEQIFSRDMFFQVHQSSALIQFLHKQNLVPAERGMFILFNSDSHFTMAAWELGKLLYINDYQYTAVEEALHFINFVPSSIEKKYLLDALNLAGALEENTALIKHLKKTSPHLKMFNYLPDTWIKAEQSFDRSLFQAYILSQCE